MTAVAVGFRTAVRARRSGANASKSTTRRAPAVVQKLPSMSLPLPEFLQPTHPGGLAALQAGRPPVIEALYRAYAGRLAHVIGRVLLEREATLDCLQELFLGLPDRLARFDGRSSLWIWLRTVAIRMAIDHARERRRRRRLHRVFTPVFGGANDAPELVAIRNEESEAVRRLLLGEPALDRAVLMLTAVEGVHYRDAAEQLGISVESLRARHKRVRARLARRLKRLRGGEW